MRRLPTTARTWKDHRRECERCETRRPHCAVGRELFEQHRHARKRNMDRSTHSGLLIGLGALTALFGCILLWSASQPTSAPDLYLMNGAILLSLGIAEIIIGARA